MTASSGESRSAHREHTAGPRCAREEPITRWEPRMASKAHRAIRYLYVCNDTPYFIRHHLPVVRAAQAAGYEVHVAVPPDESGRALRDSGIACHDIPLVRGSTNPLRELATIVDLYRLYRALAPDIVHHSTTKPVIYGGIAAQAARVPAVVNSVFGLGYVFLATGPTAAVLRFGVKLAYRLALRHRNSRLVLQNHDDLKLFVDQGLIGQEAVRVVRGVGFDPEKFVGTPEPEGTPVVLLASRMIGDKGIAEFIAAARLLREEGIEARFVLAGDVDPSNPKSLKTAELQQSHDQGFVEWLGWRTDMPSLIAQSHIICLPSYYREGLPQILIEGAAAARPIVTTDAPGCREAVIPNETGLLVPVRDPRALADALKRLITDAALRERMGQRGRRLAEEEFSLEHVLMLNLSVYEEVLHAAMLKQ